jgi:Ca2+-binding EF-hand superfamily protein
MRKFLLSIAVAATSSASFASAQEPAELFDKLDANQDGVIASEEIPGDKKGLFERLVRVGDANSDGKLSQEELKVALEKSKPQTEAAPAAGPGRFGGAPGTRPGGGPIPAKAIFERFDANGDGKLSKEEAPERMREFFGRIDQDGDGHATLAEFEKATAALSAVMQGRAGPPQAGGDRPESGRPPEGRPGEGRLGEGGPPLVRALDTDADGEISAEEIAAASKSLAKLDRNGDGKLTREEIGPPPGMMRLGEGRPEGRPGARPGGPPNAGAPDTGPFAEQFLSRLKEADTNGDKQLSREEAPERLKERFDQIDRNGDGQLDQAELKTMVERMRGAGGNRPGDRKQE